MYDDYKSRHPIDTSRIDPQVENIYSSGPFACAKPGGGAYWAGVLPFLSPICYTDWRDETLSWHLTCSFHAHLNPSPVTIVRGPEAKKFLSENFVNNIEKFPIGIIKHGLMCLENGLVAAHGVLLRSADDEYECWWHAPYINYAFSTKGYDAELIDKSMETFLFQLQGPKCLEILEEVTGESLRDIDYRHFRDSSINGHKVRVLRFGMAGTLAYEVHGETRYAKEIYKSIIDAGNPHGIRPIGILSYCMNHVEGGFPQMNNTFLSAMMMDEGFRRFSTAGKTEKELEVAGAFFQCKGSTGFDPSTHVFNPFEIGLGHCINWNHEFRGKEALREYANNKTHDIATLEWNPDDLAEIYASQFRHGEESYHPMDYPGPEHAIAGHFSLVIDKVFSGAGDEIGRSFGRTHSHYYRAMLSLASLDLAYRAEGTEVYVLWGDPGTRQKKVRAKVTRFPYCSDNQNVSSDLKVL